MLVQGIGRAFLGQQRFPGLFGKRLQHLVNSRFLLFHQKLREPLAILSIAQPLVGQQLGRQIRQRRVITKGCGKFQKAARIAGLQLTIQRLDLRRQRQRGKFITQQLFRHNGSRSKHRKPARVGMP